MAKITSPLARSDQLQQSKNILRHSGGGVLIDAGASILDYGAGTIDAGAGKNKFARRYMPANAAVAARSADLFETYTAILDGWRSIKSWKRARWSTCARRYGLSGYALYVKCWIEQKITAGFEPVSPCSRHVLDIDASPFDYTP